ncbi:CSN-associated deubiquitinating enzyme Ubp12 [Blyttiomyces sp. JEL0837]|nr:CSN-associated deubiquitinating enzyme Ubp12 [Blyttiomyces sp. JEL0837]
MSDDDYDGSDFEHDENQDDNEDDEGSDDYAPTKAASVKKKKAPSKPTSARKSKSNKVLDDEDSMIIDDDDEDVNFSSDSGSDVDFDDDDEDVYEYDPIYRYVREVHPSTPGAHTFHVDVNVHPGWIIYADINAELANMLFGNALADDWTPFDGCIFILVPYESVYSVPVEEGAESSMPGTGSTPLTLEDCLHEFMKEEVMGKEDTWFCPQCKDHKRIKKKLDIWSVPETLVFHLKRFANTGRGFRSMSGSKIDAPVEFPLTGLDLTKMIIGRSFKKPLRKSSAITLYEEKDASLPSGGGDVDMLGMKAGLGSGEGGASADVVECDEHVVGGKENGEEGEDDDEKPIYDLFAVSNHYGGVGGGHYTAFAKNPVDQNWYHFDDTKVFLVQDEEEIMTEAAYLLFYQRRRPNQAAELKVQLEEVQKKVLDEIAKEEERIEAQVSLDRLNGPGSLPGSMAYRNQYNPSSSSPSGVATVANSSESPSRRGSYQSLSLLTGDEPLFQGLELDQHHGPLGDGIDAVVHGNILRQTMRHHSDSVADIDMISAVPEHEIALEFKGGDDCDSDRVHDVLLDNDGYLARDFNTTPVRISHGSKSLPAQQFYTPVTMVSSGQATPGSSDVESDFSEDVDISPNNEVMDEAVM